ncbi:MAG TPA: hypothetical protein VMT55_04275, partial [Candidatus Sulfotelmatobacter sp.]|nr:hypothetical protein [Candidatus Sulfotelmatobacter sp.]
MIKPLLDVLGILLSFILAYYFRFNVLLFIAPSTIVVIEKYLRVMVFVVFLWLAVFKLVGLYEGKKFTVLIDELALLLWGVTLSSLLLFGLLFLYREFWFSRLVILNAWWLSFAVLAAVRFGFFAVTRALYLFG